MIAYFTTYWGERIKGVTTIIGFQFRSLAWMMIGFLIWGNSLWGRDLLNIGLLESQANQDAELELIEVPRNLTSPSDTVTIRWRPAVRGSLRFSPSHRGEDPDQYEGEIRNPLREGEGLIMFRGENLPVGYLYCIIQGPEGTASVVFNIIREADQAPRMISPVSARGEAGINSVTPIFRWEAVSGVPYYHIVVSDQPFRIIRDQESGETRVEGGNVIWQAITAQTSIQYGIPDPSEFFDNALTPPLVGSRNRNNRPRYAWVVLNNYGNHPGYTSLVTGGVSGFEVEIDPPFEQPRNITPSAGARLRDREITFRWSQVGEAANYFIYVSREEVTAGGSRAFVPAWVAQTTLTAITCPAVAVLIPGRYAWKVLAASRQARGTISDTTSFFYVISSGEVTVYTRTNQDQPLEFVQVQVEPVDGPAVPEFSTNDEGTFTRTFPVGVYRLIGRKEGYREAVSEEFRVEDEGEYRVGLQLEPLPASVVGTVKSQQDSTPIPYSRIRAVEVSTGEERWTEANVSGRFQLLLEPGSYQLRAEARGFQVSSERGLQARAGATIDLDNRFGPFFLTPYLFTVSGYVHNTLGQPINSATVIASGEGGAVLRATTPESGTYSFRLGQGRWVMSAVKPGFYLESGDVAVEITDADQEVNFTLVPQAAIVSGQVFMGGNLAQRVGEVWMIPSAGDVVICPVSNNGAFNRGLAPGNWRLIPVRTGWSALDTIDLSLGPGETVSGLRLRMVANPSVVEGRVGDEGGNPLRQVEVSGAGVRTYTDAQGNYRLSIPSGAHIISASKEGYVTAQRGPLEVEPGARIQNVNFTLPNNAAVVSGAVRRGVDPVFEATVIATRVEDGSRFTVTSDRQGNYTLNLRSGTYRLTAQKPGLVTAPPGVWEIALQPGQRVVNRNIPMLNWSARIIGRVTSPGGAVPSPNVEVIDLNQPQRVFRSSGNAEGFYQISVEPNTRFIVIARKEGFSSGRDTTRALNPEEEATINLQLQPLPAQLSGTVTSGGRGLGGVRIDARSQGQSYTGESDPDGRYRLSLPAGEFLLTASRPGYQTAETTITAIAGQEVRGINLLLRENFARVSGSVISTGGDPVNGAEVALVDSISGRTSLTRSSADGFFALDRLLPGSFILTATHPQFRRTSLNLGAVVGGQERRGVEVRMTPLQAAIMGRIEDQEGRAVAEATIFATDPSGDEFLANSDNDGRYRLLPLPAGRFRITTAKGGYTGIPVDEVALQPAETLNVNLRMVRHSGLIRGRVVVGENEGLRTAQVVVFDSLGHYGSAQTDPRGEFTLENLYPYSRYRLIAHKEGYSPVVDTLSSIVPDGRESVLYRMRANSLNLSGRVVNQGGEALPHTDLSLVSLSDGQSFRTQSDERGNFTFSSLAPLTSFQLRTHRIEEFYVNTDTTVRLEQTDRDIGSVIVVERGAALRGRVNQSDVTLTVRNLRTGRITNGYSTEEGSFRLQRLRGGDPGDFLMAAQKSGFIVRPESLVVRGVGIREERLIRTEGEWAFVFDEIRLRVSGRVRDSTGTPKAEVPVLLWSPVVQFYDTTDGEGAFRLEGVYPNLTYTLATQLPPQGFDNGRVELALTTRDTQNVTLVIGRHNATIAGIVTDDSDRPLSQVTVQLDGLRSTSTNPQGEFRIEFVGGGVHLLTFSRSGFSRLEDTVHTGIGDREEPYIGRWRLSPLHTAIYGQVREAQTEQQLPWALAILISSQGDTLIDTVGGDALFSFPNLHPDQTYRLIVKKKGWNPFEELNISVQDRSVEINPLLSLIPNTIRGSFTDPRGVRIRGGRVELRSFDHRLNIDQTDWAGEFAFNVAAGGYFIGAVHPDGRQTSWLQNLSLEEGSAVKIDLGVRASGFLRGELVDEEGRSLSIQGDLSLYHLQRGEQITIRSDTSGRFSQWGLAPGEWVLNLFAPGYALATAPPRFTFHGGDTLSLTLSLTRYGKALFGYVYQSTGEVLPGAHIEIWGPTSKELVSDQSGFWSLPHPDPGEYTLRIYRVGFLTPPDTSVTLLPGGLLQVDRTLFNKPNSASGTVRRGDGGPFPRVNVFLQEREGAVVESLLTDRFGEYEFVDLPPGDYFVRPLLSGYRSLPERRSVSLGEGETILNLDFILTRETGPAVIRGRLRHRGVGVEEAQVYLRNIETGERSITLSGTDGEFLFPSVVAPGQFRIRAVVADLAEVTSDTFSLAIGDTIVRDLNFPTGKITVQLWGEQNQPVVGRGVDVVGRTEGRRFVLFTDENGQAETPDWLSPGEWSVAPRALVGNLPPTPQPISLGEGETVSLIWHLGWRLDVTGELAMGDSGKVAVLVPMGVEVREGFLYWKDVNGIEFQRKPLRRGEGVLSHTSLRPFRMVTGPSPEELPFSGEILYEYLPPQTRAGWLTFYLDITTQDGLHFGGPQTAVQVPVTTAGVIERIILRRTPSGLSPRVGVAIQLSADPRDARGQPLAEAIRETGRVVWSSLRPGKGSLTPHSEDPLIALYIPQQVGEERIAVEIFQRLPDGSEISIKDSIAFTWRNTNPIIGNIILSGPSSLEAGDSVKLTITATDTGGAAIPITPLWSWSPSQLAEISPVAYAMEGKVKTYPYHIGQLQIALEDTLSGLRASFNGDVSDPSKRGLEIYGTMVGGREGMVSFTDGEGFFLHIPRSIFPSEVSSRVSLFRPQIPTAMRLTARHIAAPFGYRISLSQPPRFGSTFRLKLPLPQGFKEGDVVVGRWDDNLLEWVTVLPQRVERDSGFVEAELEAMSGLFSVISLSPPLGIHNLTFNPNPFSPLRSGKVWCEFDLTSNLSEAPTLNIKIYNMAGELVRVVQQGSLPKGSYKRGDPRTPFWDGKTDASTEARNGRYVVEVIAEDTGGRVEKRGIVVLVR